MYDSKVKPEYGKALKVSVNENSWLDMAVLDLAPDPVRIDSHNPLQLHCSAAESVMIHVVLS